MGQLDAKRGRDQERTLRALRLDVYDSCRTYGKYQIPIIRKVDYIPEGLIAFKYMLADRYRSCGCGIHFFIDDYQFERVWSRPRDYIYRIKRYACALTPDFSVYTDMPLALQIYNVYRLRLIGQMMQDEGITVIPTIQYAGPETYEFCFDGIEPGGVIATSTVGCSGSMDVWRDGMDEANSKFWEERRQREAKEAEREGREPRKIPEYTWKRAMQETWDYVHANPDEFKKGYVKPTETKKQKQRFALNPNAKLTDADKKSYWYKYLNKPGKTPDGLLDAVEFNMSKREVLNRFKGFGLTMQHSKNEMASIIQSDLEARGIIKHKR